MREGLFVIEENQPLTEKVHRLRLSGDTGAIAAPGQFVQLSLPGFFLRRPFSVSDWGEGWLSLLVERVGDGTACLHGLPAGTELSLLTGLGRGYDLSAAGSSPLLVSGGTGCSPLLGLAKRLLEKGIRPRLLLGFHGSGDAEMAALFTGLGCSLELVTEDGSVGRRGLVTDDPALLACSFCYACGSEAMLRALAAALPSDGEFAFDVRMGCGFGACMGCSIRTPSGLKRVCKDGPVFRKEDLLWED